MSRNVQSLERGLMVLEALVNRGPKGVTELSKELELDKTIVYRLLSTLQSLEYIQQDNNRKYETGMKLRQIGAKLVSGFDVRELAIPYMQELAEFTRGVSHLARMADDRAVYIEKVQHPSLTVKTTDVGGEAPGYCSGAGKILWAHLPPTELNELLMKTNFRQHTVNTITDSQLLQQHLAEIRELGYAVDKEEHRLGLYGIAAPVFDHTGAIIAAICIAAQTNGEIEMKLEVARGRILEVAQEISTKLGYFSGDI